MLSNSFNLKHAFGLDPIDVRFLEIEHKVWPDRTRITFKIRIIPFKLPPTLELKILSDTNHPIAEVMIIETQENEIEFTMHIPRMEYKNSLTFEAILKYEEFGQVDFHSFLLNV